MSKTNEHALLLPGESGWEIWTRPSSGGFTLLTASDVDRAGDLENLPAGDLQMFFPVRALTSVPLRVSSEDDSLFEDLATLHIERLGLRPDPMAGQLTDLFTISREGEETALVSVLLKSPSEGDLPKRGPKGFDISPRTWHIDGNVLVLWKEFHRWVFALYHGGKFAYSQATAIASHSPDADLAREIRLAMIQLGIQGLEFSPERILVWSDAENIDPSALSAAFESPVEVSPRPTPALPEQPSKLLPADVRAARREALKRRNVTLGIAAVSLFYLGLVGWLGFGLWKDSSETKKLLQQANASAPERIAYETHLAKWDELSQAIDLNHNPVDILLRVARSIPQNSGLRLRTAEISSTEVKLVGEASQAPPVNQFSLALSRNNDLANFNWERPEPSQSTRGWEFVFTGTTPQQP